MSDEGSLPPFHYQQPLSTKERVTFVEKNSIDCLHPFIVLNGVDRVLRKKNKCSFHLGSSINDVTQFWTFLDPLTPPPPPSSRLLLLRPLYCCHKILDLLPLRTFIDDPLGKKKTFKRKKFTVLVRPDKK